RRGWHGMGLMLQLGFRDPTPCCTSLLHVWVHLTVAGGWVTRHKRLGTPNIVLHFSTGAAISGESPVRRAFQCDAAARRACGSRTPPSVRSAVASGSCGPSQPS